MVTQAQYTKWRRFYPYGLWSKQVVDIWNETIKLQRIIKRLSKDEATENEDDYRSEIARVRSILTPLEKKVSRMWVSDKPIDVLEVPRALKHRDYFVAEGITFETAIANTGLILEETESELDDLIEAEVWLPFVYTFTFVSTQKKSGAIRHVEAHFEGLVLESEIDNMKKFVEPLVEKYVREQTYDFIYDELNTEPEIHGYMFKDPVGKPTENNLKIEIFDYNFNLQRARADAISSPKFWEEGEEVLKQLRLNTVSIIGRGNKGLPRSQTKQTELKP